jgi:hypothetical protein
MSLVIDFINSKQFESFNDLKSCFEELKIEVKETEKLFMLCFISSSDLEDKMIRECNGIIFEKETNKLVHYTFPKCYDYAYEDSDVSLDTRRIKDDTTEVVNWFIDGSIIKLFYYDSKWSIATSRNIEGFKNKWSSSKTFEDLFKDAVEISHSTIYDIYLETLDKSCSYSYIIQHPEHITAIKVGVPIAILLNMVNNTSLVEVLPELENFKINKTVQEIQNNPNRSVADNYIIYKVDKNNNVVDRIKLLSPAFIKLKNIFGNYPNIGLRYLELLHNDLGLNMLIMSYPDDFDTFEQIEKLITNACQTIHKLYVKTRIQKVFTEYDKKYSKVLYQLHKDYIDTQKKVDILDVYYRLENLGKTNPRFLAGIIGFKY